MNWPTLLSDSHVNLFFKHTNDDAVKELYATHIQSPDPQINLRGDIP